MTTIRKPKIGEYIRRNDGEVLMVTNNYGHLIGVTYIDSGNESYRIGPREFAAKYELLPDYEPPEWDE